MAGRMLQNRGLSASSLMGNNFSAQQEFILQIVALIASGISILGGAFALYWFYRIKTHFRHQLVTFLICSDLFKAVWYFISAAVSLRVNPGRLDYNFCQASGFFLAFGIEASDYAILVIAIHSALCIFRPKTNLGETGLFGIRYLVYALWIALPLLAAGLGLMHGGVYIDTGAYCWLPLRPFYYRLALSWIPRYLIFITILFLYARIYWFVSSKFDNFHRNAGDSYRHPSELANGSVSRSRRAISQIFGAKPVSNQVESPQSNSDHSSQEMRSMAVTTLTGDSPTAKDTASGGPSWENYTFGSTSPLPGPARDEVTAAPARSAGASETTGSISTQRTHVPGSVGGDTRKSLVEFLKEEPPEGFMVGPPISTALVTEEVNQETRSRQTAIKRQLRFMFIYPLFYMISWIPPLVQHFTLYNDDVASHPNFALACISTTFVALQCFMDSVIFSYRETPWRYVEHKNAIPDIDQSQMSTAVEGEPPAGGSGSWLPFSHKNGPRSANGGSVTQSDIPIGIQSIDTTNTGTPRSSLLLRIGSTFRHPVDNDTSNRHSGSSGKFFLKSQGKSRGEMIAEARAARHRRELEITTAREGQEERQRQRKQSILRRGGADRSWWEVEGRKRKDSVLLGSDLELSRSRSRSNTEGTSVISPTSLTSNLFNPRRLRGSFASASPSELSPRSRMPLDSGGPSSSSTPNVVDDALVSPKDTIEAMPSVREEDGPSVPEHKD